jgi:hypothetical protein
MFTALVLLAGTLVSCEEIFSPAGKTLSAQEVAKTQAHLIQIPLNANDNHIDVCCTGAGTAADILDGNVNTFWGSNYNASAPSESFYGPHYVNIDLGMSYDNVSRIEYIPIWRWDGPGGYDGSWVSGGPAGVVNNGVVTSFEIYLTEEPLKPGEVPPAESLAAKGNWYALESGSNTLINTSTMKFFATFASAKGRYLQFRILSGYRNHWAAGLSAIGQVAELRVWRTDRPMEVDTAGLKNLLDKANILRAGMAPRYGYTNAMLNNWGGKAEGYLNNPKGITQEGVNYVRANLDNFVTLAGKRAGMGSYDRFVQKILWADEKGNHLQAHGGGTLWDPVSQKWWFYGEDRTNTTGGGQPGVHAYSSTDLYNWKDEGVALPIFNNTVYDEPTWREASSLSPSGFAGGWDGNRRNESGWNPAVQADAPHVSGFMWTVNKWRQSLGDWNADGVIDPAGEYYPNGRLTGTAGTAAGQNSYVQDADSVRYSAKSKDIQNVLWNSIKNYIPSGNPPLYLWQDPAAKPYPTAMGLTEGKIGELNALYRDIPVWRRKQLYRFWNHTTTVERPKVIYNAGVGAHALTGNPIKPYEDSGGIYPYVMFTHIEGGVVGIGYGTAKVLIAVAKKPEGPYKILWAYHKHFVEGLSYSTDHMGMSRDQSVLVDDDGTAYHFGSTQENRIMGIDMLNESYTQFVGLPLQYPVGESHDQLIEEGYDNRLGVYFNFVYGDQREAPAPFLHYTTGGMTYEGVFDADGNRTGDPVSAVKYYYMASSTSTGWFPNPQGVYRTSQPGGRILGNPNHAKTAPGSGNTNSINTGEGTAPGTGNTGTGWIGISGNGYSVDGGNGTFFFGVADDGSRVSKGYDGQTTYVQQLRYPAYKWGIVGFQDSGFIPPDTATFTTPESYLAELQRMYSDGECILPIYGETEIPEPRVGKLVYGKYIHMSDSWDSTKNYDARYIWLPMRVVPNGTENTNASRGARARWMQQWRWQDFVYDLGPFANSLTPLPPVILDSTGANSPSMWTVTASPQNLVDYYEMLETCFGSSAGWYLNPGKQNPGQDWLQEWLYTE